MSLSFWVFVVLACVFLTPIYAVYSENSEVRTNRSQYLNWFLVYLSVIYLLPIFVNPESVVSFVSILLIDIVVSYFFMQKVVQRCRDAGVAKKECYYALIPVLGFVVTIALLFKDSLSEIDHSVG